MTKDTTKKKRLKTAKEKRADEEHLAKMIEANREFLINCACDFAHEVQEYEYDVGYVSIRTLTMLVDSTSQIRGARQRVKEKRVYFDHEEPHKHDATWHKAYKKEGAA